MHCFVEGLPEVSGVKVIICFSEAELGHDITRISCPRSVEWQNTIGPSILFDPGTQLSQLGLDHRLEIVDLPLREVGCNGIAQTTVMLMRRRSEKGVIGAEPGRERSVLVKLARFHVEFLEVVGINYMQLIWCHADNRAYRQ